MIFVVGAPLVGALLRAATRAAPTSFTDSLELHTTEPEKG